jgi:Mor family transcriptional regulator
MLNKLEIKILKNISALQKENSQQEALNNNLDQEMEKNIRISLILTLSELTPLPPNS